MAIGKQIRLGRLFSHPSGRFCSVAVDHFITYQEEGFPDALRDMPALLPKLVAGKPDAITMQKGAAKILWGPHAGKCPLIIGSVTFMHDDTVFEPMATPEEALRMGADAYAMAIGVRGPNELRYLNLLSNAVKESAAWDMPVVAHIYPRDFSGPPKVVHDPENVFWAVRCGIECGADVIKVPFTGDSRSFADIVSTCPLPLVAAGGPKAGTLRDTLAMMTEVVASGARGATIGRNIWATSNPTEALRAFKGVIHDGLPPEQALQAASEGAAISDP